METTQSDQEGVVVVYPGDSNIYLVWTWRREPLSQITVVALCPLTSNNRPSSFSPGVVRQVRPIVGPFYAVLRLEMNYVLGGVVSHRNVVNVHIFVSEYWF